MAEKVKPQQHRVGADKPVPFDDALRRILNAPPQPRVAKKKAEKEKKK